MNLEFDIVIPARYESSRLPGKLLEDICGKSMIRRVIERSFTSSATRVIVAYDDERIRAEVESVTNAVTCKTSPAHPCGTDRVAEAVQNLGLPDERMIVNVQGDEPMITGSVINRVAQMLHGSEAASVATAAQPIDAWSQLNDPNVVKCAIDRDGYALYFSRSPIPWQGSARPASVRALHHIGIYAYRVGYLVRHAGREVCGLEVAEKLEQLRVLYNGDRIVVAVDKEYRSLGVDTYRELELVRRLVADA